MFFHHRYFMDCRFNTAVCFVRMVSIVAVTLFLSCTTARDRGEREDLFATLQFSDNNRQAYLKFAMKSGDIYDQYTPILHIDAFHRNEQYIRRLASEYGDTIFKTEKETRDFLEKELMRKKKFTSFIVSLHQSNGEDMFAEKSGRWSIYIRIDKNRVLVPAEMIKLAEENNETIYLKKYLRTFDRFSELYRVNFPAINHPYDETTDIATTRSMLTLTLSGIRGSAKMVFPIR